MPTLTRRQHDVMAALSEGLTLREAGERLGIARETAHAHCTKVLGRLGVHSRLAALCRLWESGELDLPTLRRAPTRGRDRAARCRVRGAPATHASRA